MASTSTGLLEWANDIRFSLANDPGRLAFQESVQEHGLLYLDDWFENLLQSSHQPETSILDLVKTPKRSHASPKKPRLPSKLQQALKFDGPSGQENRSPNRDLERAALQSKPSEDDIFRTPFSPPHTPLGPAVVVNVSSSDPYTLAPPESLDLLVAHIEQPNLSSIAEDEEPSENKVSQALRKTSQSRQSLESRDTFHSVTLDSPKPVHVQSAAIPPPSRIAIPDAYDEDRSQGSPSPSQISTKDAEIPEAQTPDLPVPSDTIPTATNTVTERVVEKHEDMAATVQPATKELLSKPLYVSLPDPVPPVRKSSWLQKAREVKASENTTRKYSVVAPPYADAQPTMKRKSDVMLTDVASKDHEERLSKVPKRIEGDIAPVEASGEKPKSVKGKTLERDSPAVSSPTAGGMLDMLKQTLGNYRFGMGKSLSGTAALNELAEARAAAEARLAEQEKSIVNEPAPPQIKPVAKPSAQLPRSSQDRLSLSELAPLVKPSEIGVPPQVSALASGPVFVPPPPVFVHPSPPVFVLPRTLSTEPKLPPLSQKSSVESLASERVFDSQPDAGPSTQETEYDEIPVEADDSWLDDKMPEGAAWTLGFNGKESVTWSSNATESQRLELTGSKSGRLPDRPTEELAQETYSPKIPGSSDIKLIPKRLPSPTEDVEDLPLATSGSSPHDRSLRSQASQMASSVLDSSMSKKSKTEVKSLQLAAAKAKKEQEEKDKKVAVMKNMEQRRQQAQLRKAEEERARSEEKEKKVRDEADRRKRERDEQTDKRPVKPTVKKDDDASKKRKAQAELEKQPDSKKTTQASFRPGPAKQQPQASSSQLPPAAGPSQERLPKAMSSSKPPPPLKSKMHVTEDDMAQPSQVVHSQMAARARLQLQQASGQIASEDIELPDIASEYSDSDDEDRAKSFNPPDWAQSPFLRQQLRNQSTINPDAIFGPVQPLRMEDIFKGQSARLMRPRSSSANWAGSDRLTQEEQRDYDRRMGYTQPGGQ